MSMLSRGEGVRLRDNPVFRKLADSVRKRQQEDEAWSEFYEKSHKRRSVVLQSSNPQGR